MLVIAGAGTAHASGDLYGAIAEQTDAGFLGASGIGVAVDYPTQEAADQAALISCERQNPRCFVVTRIHNECAAAAEFDIRSDLLNTVRPAYTFGKGPTPAAAETAAIDQANRIANDNPIAPLTLSHVVNPPFILDTICTSNIG
ncbi:DUF4189 domain-containing protein [Nocardia yamanashiensis]|uniref:DUF4189 domain-containing protein n=1 Tax=Nocardia yamanashiensis TaxID=209247 RepID=UPI001E3E1616|nr:DUF4189 domain-containing protein [Nocardia yamanashiensis]UGT41641.1 DUF4189 domain-containing protein [Nocardia yamanashiensis]